MMFTRMSHGMRAALYRRSAGLCVLLLTMALVACADRPLVPAPTEACVVIDNDYDIDDMMALPMVVANKSVAAVVQSEGYSLPEVSAPAVARLINAPSAFANGRAVPVIVGSRASQPVDLAKWPWLTFFRNMMASSNGFLPSPPVPAQPDPEYPVKVQQTVSHCQSVSVLIVGTYSSFVNYSPMIRHKIDKVVIMGKPMARHARPRDKQSFNCAYDLQACREAMVQLQGLSAFFVDIPRVEGCDGPAPPLASCYSPTLDMVQGQDGQGGLLDEGLPGRLKKALINDFDCHAVFTPGMPAVPGTACTSRSTWVPTEVMAGPGGKMLFWDQTAALFLLYPDLFALNTESAVNQFPGHFEPRLVNGSHAQTIQRLRTLWTESTNRGL